MLVSSGVVLVLVVVINPALVGVNQIGYLIMSRLPQGYRSHEGNKPVDLSQVHQTHGKSIKRRGGRPKIRNDDPWAHTSIAIPRSLYESIKEYCEEQGVSVSGYFCAVSLCDQVALGRIRKPE